MSQPPENLEPHQPDVNSTQQADSSTPQNVVQGNQNRVVQGDNNKSVLGDNNTVVQGNNNWLGNTWNLFFGKQTTPVGNPARPVNQRMLLAEVKQEVVSRLKQSLHNTVLINLGKELQPEQVIRPWDSEIKIGSKPLEPIPQTTKIIDVFVREEIAGRLLILGTPGSGKTTTLLELAQALIERAEVQADYPIPVLFNLSSWKDDNQSIAEWLVAELQSKYSVSSNLGKTLLKERQLLPMLDGLDELKSVRQELCVRKINQFFNSEYRTKHLVVCSRIDEYKVYQSQLLLRGAICLQPLSYLQIRSYLTSLNRTELWSGIRLHDQLLELISRPLFLSFAVLAEQELSIPKWQEQISRESRIQYLISAYTRRMLTRKINENNSYSGAKLPTSRQTQFWLNSLAQQMERMSETEFLIERMQPYWLKNNSLTKIYKLIFGITFGLNISLWIGIILVLIGGLNAGVFGGLLLGGLFGVIFGLVGGLTSEHIFLFEIIIWRNIRREDLFSGLLIGLSIGLPSGGFMGWRWLIILVIAGLLIGIINGLISRQPILDIKTKITPNQGIWRTTANAVFFGVIGGLSIGVIGGISFGIIGGISFGVIGGLIFGLLGGGNAAIQHFSLRLTLYLNSYIPWNYARFLDYCTERMLLQRVGGRYRFIHKLLQDHFAQMEFRRN
ncbi:MAG: NACHT domain-containing protein [Nostoc sp. GBBB01]|nr:NACHT domain-containing protein [Nostoc sp. GBBB01]